MFLTQTRSPPPTGATAARTYANVISKTGEWKSRNARGGEDFQSLQAAKRGEKAAPVAIRR